MHYPSWSRPAHLFELLVSEQAWGRLGPGGQQGIEQACRQNLRRSLVRIPDSERQALADLRKRGVTVQPYPQAVLASVRQATQKALDAMAREDVTFARVLASYNKYR
jgi:TRAP-type mannitol/chloroaromatic compound transport system substrate-binding protein